MHRTLQRAIEVIGLFGLVAAVSGCAHHAHHGRGARGDGAGLTVLGTGEARAQPDIARSSMGIEVRAATVEEATTQANARMAAVIQAIKGAGIAETDLRTHDFSVSFERDFQPPQPVVMPEPAPKGRAAATAAPAPAPQEGPRGSYRVSNTVEVVIRDIAKVSQVLTAATGAGANNVWGISFELSDREPLHQKARAQAIERAKQNAQQLAQLTGVKLGRIVAIDDQQGGGEPRMYAASARMAEASDSSVPVQGGEVTISHQVRLVYDLNEP